ncbi:hypothetical protein Lalb_Chr00c29g0407871 (mitochondrion) [Lupinus albus]|uniref:Uncharacterized protein n=1 Tax=Lupinus albus TaxID=3870 RepID=A0A6A4MS05_LUPAL|nr:hypothetical protein Lalb_Chr00c29g0407871 [Lupinus albus]
MTKERREDRALLSECSCRGSFFSILESDSFSTSLSARAFHSYLSLDYGMIKKLLSFSFAALLLLFLMPGLDLVLKE